MKGLLTYPSEYNSGSQFIWRQDNGKAMKNKGFVNRVKFYSNKDNVGKFSVILLLDHMFGFCENYRKDMYELKHVLTLYRNHNNDEIIKSAEQGEVRDSVTDGKIDTKKISWHMSHIQLSDQAQLSLYSDIKSKKSLQIAFLNWQSGRIS